ncbi:hypothetical protein BKP35_18535 [Anaerobacillus arseniciselenatis]|uniref:Uncharacterized protein n=2 Tax=Anaerobacillus arseniciselenatis TaxID=85682 RepID=A0A1S2L7D0_9BACI|nr:hypothetical protein BKP35_18535 [Anaerobacillus arseniciselenatis]
MRIITLSKKSGSTLGSPEKRWRASGGLSPLMNSHLRVDKHRWIEALEGLGAVARHPEKRRCLVKLRQALEGQQRFASPLKYDPE